MRWLNPRPWRCLQAMQMCNKGQSLAADLVELDLDSKVFSKQNDSVVLQGCRKCFKHLSRTESFHLQIPRLKIFMSDKQLD